jgi:putative ABC transport system ATP-binding protein
VTVGAVDAPPSGEPVIRLHGLTKVFAGPPPVRALDGVNLTVAAGDFLSVMGRSGSGKSTLLHILGLLDTATGGTYHFDGTDVSGLPERQRTFIRGRRIGFVHQGFQLLNDRSAIENVMLSTLYRNAKRSDSEAASLRALDMVGLADRAGQSPRVMSGGERQRVAIARALAGDPLVLLCDEPTGNLDSANTAAILRIFARLNDAGVTIVLITHDAAVARTGHRIVHMADGELRAADGDRPADDGTWHTADGAPHDAVGAPSAPPAAVRALPAADGARPAAYGVAG